MIKAIFSPTQLGLHVLEYPAAVVIGIMILTTATAKPTDLANRGYWANVRRYGAQILCLKK
jgi:hypothetical protein